ncbi:uncharacterized protein CIMG_11121 [Coccidioides immitis RS]|uniref:Uncharacterized protein n=3 Tax=Coccidioides immitis TaxID=5501 RepID=A0A0D8JVZ6_COCIM|nr:uncharacterized protein CIMG_11121 [Coccidioides immitis RS]KJF61500.1 hypothetical protein CIMG_11121 [Coccidioides immitis RS]KMP07649.1 hypothetical protein CIRG_07330 [Coccidioides immitis RMSCC 2394]KMU71900.1 hypothetical protein CISG_00209 [Coccidioides immitis RMSCC 3703]TPX19547.1 hypothetical protein DIZ76_017339 [Coccidioides immitis]
MDPEPWHTPATKHRKPRRKILTSLDRRRICLYREKNPHVTQSEIGDAFGVDRSFQDFKPKGEISPAGRGNPVRGGDGPVSIRAADLGSADSEPTFESLTDRPTGPLLQASHSLLRQLEGEQEGLSIGSGKSIYFQPDLACYDGLRSGPGGPRPISTLVDAGNNSHLYSMEHTNTVLSQESRDTPMILCAHASGNIDWLKATHPVPANNIQSEGPEAHRVWEWGPTMAQQEGIGPNDALQYSFNGAPFSEPQSVLEDALVNVCDDLTCEVSPGPYPFSPVPQGTSSHCVISPQLNRCSIRAKVSHFED